MKNKTISSYLILLSIATLLSLYIPKNEVTAKEEIIIPNEAIRLRILANSDSESDQNLKRKVRDAVNAEITEWVQDLTSLEEARKTIQSGLPEIQQIAERIVQEENSNQAVKAEFNRVKFPTKLYGQFLYPAGEYEAILITIGQGEGANWWCVLFPPLCFLDFSNGVAVSEGFDEEEENKDNKNQAEIKDNQAPETARISTSLDKLESIDSSNNTNPTAKTVPANGAVEDEQEENTNKDNAKAANQSNVVSATQSSKTNSNNPTSKFISENKDSNGKASQINKSDDENANEKASQTVKSDAETAYEKASRTVKSDSETANEKTSQTVKSDKKVSKRSSTVKAESKKANSTKTAKAPVFTGNDEQEIEVKFFVKELWTKIF